MAQGFKPSLRLSATNLTRQVESAQKTERRAQRVLELWADKPSLRRDEIHGRIRREFKCGIGAADRAITRAYEYYAENSQDLQLTDRLAQHYWDIAEEAKKAGKFRDATKALDSLRAHLGIGAPERLELTNKTGVDMAELTQEEIDMLARLDRARDVAPAAETPPDEDESPVEH